MSIRLEIIADNVPQLHDSLQKILYGNGMQFINPGPEIAVPSTASEPAKPEPAPAAPKEEIDGPKPPKKKKEKEAVTVEQAPAAAATTEATLEDCRAMIKKINASDGKNGEAGGLDKAIKIITGFGVAKVQDLPKEKYADFIKECEKQLLIPIEKKEEPKVDKFF